MANRAETLITPGAGKLTRREFLKWTAAASAALATGAAAGALFGDDVLYAVLYGGKDCSDALPPLYPYPEPLSQFAYDRLSHTDKAKFLLHGGYAEDWKKDGVDGFIEKMQEAAKEAITQIYCDSTLLCYPDALREQIVTTKSKEDFIETLIDLGDPQDDAEYYYENTWAITGTYPTDDPKKRIVRRIMNFSPMAQNKLFLDADGNPDYHYITLMAASTVEHEVLHTPGSGLFDDQQMQIMADIFRGKIKDASDKIRFERNVGLSLYFYDPEGPPYTFLIFNNGFEESARALRQKIFDEKLGVVPYMGESVSDYAGVRALEYLNYRLNISDDEFALVMALLEKGNLENTDVPTNPILPSYNLLDVIHYYVQRAIRAGYSSARREDIADLFIAVNNTRPRAKKTMENIDIADTRLCRVNDVYGDQTLEVERILQALK